MSGGRGDRPFRTPAVHSGPGEEPEPPPPLPVESVAVVGLGLVGGSVARALSALDPAPRVVGMTKDAADAEGALETRAVDEVLTGPAGLAGVELVVYAVPLSALVDLLPDHAPHLGAAVLTDVASLKVPVVEAMRTQGLADAFVGAHPMTGGEGSGFGASRATLFRGAPIHLTGDTGSDGTRSVVETFWRALGAHPSWTSAVEHDRRMVWLSHLPQLAANALAAVLIEADVVPDELGPGGRDMTRLAASSSVMWRDLVTHAAGLDAEALRTLAERAEALAADLEAGHFEAVENLMDATRVWRRGGRGG